MYAVAGGSTGSNGIQIVSSLGKGEAYLASATYAPSSLETGWSHFKATTAHCDTKQNDIVKAYAAGYL